MIGNLLGLAVLLVFSWPWLNFLCWKSVPTWLEVPRETVPWNWRVLVHPNLYVDWLERR